MSDEISARDERFEALKKRNDCGVDFWHARDLQAVLGYNSWRRFEIAIKKAITSCKTSGNDPQNHFVASDKMVGIGSGGERPVGDYLLSRFACYLIAQNGDSRKPEIANAQTYFAIQARRQELSDQHQADIERLEWRDRASEEFKFLSGAAKEAGVQSRMFGVFHDAGYRGLYGGLGVAAIREKKNIPENHQILDRMDTTELAANQFRMTQTREKLARDAINSEQRAIDVHKQVGREVRAAIAKIGGRMPEDIPAAEHIKEVEKRIEGAVPRIELEDEDSRGLRVSGTEEKDGEDE